jgi:hypothetical protein
MSSLWALPPETGVGVWGVKEAMFEWEMVELRKY